LNKTKGCLIANFATVPTCFVSAALSANNAKQAIFALKRIIKPSTSCHIATLIDVRQSGDAIF
jgi:hypothetical protein